MRYFFIASFPLKLSLSVVRVSSICIGICSISINRPIAAHIKSKSMHRALSIFDSIFLVIIS